LLCEISVSFVPRPFKTCEYFALNFSSEVLLNDEVIGAGDGKSKKSAQQSAAKDALAKLDA